MKPAKKLMNMGENESQDELFSSVFKDMGNVKMKIPENINSTSEESSHQIEGMSFLGFESKDDSESQGMNFLNFESNQNNQIKKNPPLGNIPSKTDFAVKTSNLNKNPNMAQIKRNRNESCIISEAIQEEEEFFKERDRSNQLREKNQNVKSSNAGVKNYNFQQIRENLKKKPEQRKKPQNEQICHQVDKIGSKKVILEENKEAVYGEWLSKYQELEKIYFEKKESLKKIENINKFYQDYYIKFENFKAKLPMYIEKSLQCYYDLLLEYESYCDIEDPEIDRLIEENRGRIVRIKEKFGFDHN